MIPLFYSLTFYAFQIVPIQYFFSIAHCFKDLRVQVWILQGEENISTYLLGTFLLHPKYQLTTSFKQTKDLVLNVVQVIIV